MGTNVGLMGAVIGGLMEVVVGSIGALGSLGASDFIRALGSMGARGSRERHGNRLIAVGVMAGT